MSFKNEIEDLIKVNLKNYEEDSDNFIREYNLEKEFTKEYNGRQLLELLQNADDEESEEVLIEWNKESSKISISNNGTAFTLNGIKSLMRAGLSSKTKIVYIGNKGLGFRSILNWAEQINIYTNGCKISFSENIAKDIFENHLNLTKDKIHRLKEDRNFSDTAIPFPILGIPKIKENNNHSDWKTTIEIFCKQNIDTEIEKQISEITEEILLFLNNITEISIINDDAKKITFKSDKIEGNEFDTITIKNKSWKVFSRKDKLPQEYQDTSKNELQSYSLKVAFQDDLSDSYYKLFNFFPTQLSIALPCIIHGTFDLNSSRNHLNGSKKNEYILKELVQLLKKCSIYLTKESIDWKPFKLINPISSASDSELIKIFYRDLEDLKKTEVIYPSVNNQYSSQERAVYYNYDFNSFFKDNFPSLFPELVIPMDADIEKHCKSRILNHEYLVTQIDELSNTSISIELRAELIVQLSKIINFKEDTERFSLLVDDKFEKVIPKLDTTFTPVLRSDKSFNIPDSIKVHFMNSKLHDILNSKLEHTFDKKEPRSRELQRCIKSVVNLQPYDSNNVIDKIINGTNDILKKLTNIDEKQILIKEMISALFENFKNIDNRQEKLNDKDVPLISKSKIIVNAKDLFLSKSYPTGELVEIIYNDSLSRDEYLAGTNYWGLENEELNLVETFFLWLGVNKFSKLKSIQLTDNLYFDFIFKNDISKPDDFIINKLKKDYSTNTISNFKKIKELPINNILLLVMKDPFLRQSLEQFAEPIEWFFANSWRKFSTQFSYIRYQFISSNLFTKYVLEDVGEEINNLINEDFKIDYDFFDQHGINKADIKSILIKLGAKESFNEIAPQNIYEILKTVRKKDTESKGKLTQSIYKLALESLVRQESKHTVPNDLELFYKKDNEEGYQLASNLYYADNSILPKKILDTLPLINLQKRIGSDNVSKYFNITSLSTLKVEIIEESIKVNLQVNLEFGKLFENLKPYLLAYRLNSGNLKKKISEEGRRRYDEAKAIKYCTLTLVNECDFNFNDIKNQDIGEKEYINIGRNFYYRDSSISSIDQLKKSSEFCDAFAEMMCIVFKVNDLKNDFRQIFKNDLQDTIHLANQDLEVTKIDEAFLLLGVSRIEIDFWKKVFELSNKSLKEPIENVDVLKSIVEENIGFVLPDEYDKIDFENFKNKESFEFIKSLTVYLNKKVNDIIPNGLYYWHKSQFENKINDFGLEFKQRLWYKLNEDPKNQTAFICILNSYNKDFVTKIDIDINKHRFEINVDYSDLIEKNIEINYKVLLNKNLEIEYLIKNFYESLLIKYSFEESDINDESIRSLLFFENNYGKVEEYLKTKTEVNSKNNLDDANSQNNGIGTIIDATLTKKNKTSSQTANNSSNTWVHSGKGDAGKKKIGKSAEQLVYNTLVDTYGKENVNWVSGFSTNPNKDDSLHYDIEYKNEKGDRKFLEVKSISDNQFIISYSEVEKGKAEPDKYEIALVNNNTIYLLKDLFKFEQGESFDNNSKFIANTKDYIFSFKIDISNKD